MGKRKRDQRSNTGAHDSLAIDPAASKLKFNSYEDLADSEDEFHLNRDKVAFGESRDAKRSKSDAEEALELSDEEVLGYSDGVSGDEDSDAEHDDLANDDISDASKGSGSQERDEEEDTTNWGTSRADYYNADTIETEQDALDEEAEARRIQQKRLRALNEADFGFDENAWVGVGEADETKQHGGVVTEVLPQLQVTEDMNSSQRLKLLKARYPEFEPLSREMIDLQPLRTRLFEELQTRQTLPSAHRISTSVVSMKFNALSGYLGALAMYFAILTSTATSEEPKVLPMAPGELREHEIMDVLVRCRDLWESVKDLQQTPAHELSASPISTSDSAAAQEKSASETEIEEESMPRHQESQPIPRPTTSSEARREARLRRTEESLAALTTSINAANRRHHNSSSTNRQAAAPIDLDSDAGDEPISADPARRKKTLNFYTSQLAQKASKRARAATATGGDDDVPHRERLRDRQDRLNREAVGRARQDSSAGDELGGADTDDEEETNAQREARASDAGELDEAARALEERVRAKKATKAQRRDERQRGQQQQHQRPLERQLADAEGYGRREVGYAIEKNKGLTPRRKKEVRNPRLKKRLRFEDKQKKLRSMKATYKGGEGRGGYGGELTGIKKGLVKSVKL